MNPGIFGGIGPSATGSKASSIHANMIFMLCFILFFVLLGGVLYIV